MSTAPRPAFSAARRWLQYVPAAAWAAFLLYLGTRTFDQPVLPYRFPIDKVAHLGLYGILGALAVIGWRRAGRWPAWWLPLVAVLGVGVADELRQTQVAARTGDPLDLAADFIAIVVAFVVLGRWNNRQGADED